MDGPGLAWPIHFTLNSRLRAGRGLRQPQFSDFVKPWDPCRTVDIILDCEYSLRHGTNGAVRCHASLDRYDPDASPAPVARVGCQPAGRLGPGGISNLARPASGHIYFTLKDSNSSLKCVMWRSDAARLRLALQDGLAVDVHGSISLYEAGGQYQLYADTLRPLGEGALYQEFLRLKATLEAEGFSMPSASAPSRNSAPHRHCHFAYRRGSARYAQHPAQAAATGGSGPCRNPCAG